MTTQDKLQRANELSEEIDRTESFIKLASEAQKIDEKNAKNNELKGINRFSSCTISAYISTGSQSPEYEKVITGDDVITDLMAGGLDFVKAHLKVKKEEFNQLFASK